MKCYSNAVATLLAITLTMAILTGCEKPATTNKPNVASTTAITASSTASILSTTATTLSQSAVTATAILPTPTLSTPATTLASSTHNAGNNKSLITQATAPNTPEDVLKKSMDALMSGNAKEAASYYHIEGIDMAQILNKQIPTLKKQLKHLDISPTEYNTDNTKAGIIGKLTMANSKQPKQTLYKFEKINGEWKIVE